MLRGAGWDVHVAADLGGSYEELPPNLVAHAARERRWCQGNLQHVRLLFAPTFTLASRLILAVGALSYLCGPAWVLFVVAISLSPSVPGLAGFMEHVPPDEHSLARVFGATLIALTLSFLVLPKLFALVRLRMTPGAVALRGGWGSVIASLTFESLFALLVTPVLLTFQAAFVFAILSGRNAGWNVQSRGEATLSVGAAFHAHGLQTIAGLAAAALLLATDSFISIWLLPSVVGLWVAIPLSAVTSRVEWGLWTRRRRLFLIPEEVAPSPVLQAAGPPFRRPTRPGALRTGRTFPTQPPSWTLPLPGTSWSTIAAADTPFHQDRSPQDHTMEHPSRAWLCESTTLISYRSTDLRRSPTRGKARMRPSPIQVCMEPFWDRRGPRVQSGETCPMHAVTCDPWGATPAARRR